MIKFRARVVLAAAATFAAINLSAPAWSAASNSVPDRVAEDAEKAQAHVPTPKARPVRKRVAVAAPVRRLSAPPVVYPWYAPYPRVAVHWPVLILGIGY
jgi:hypothetical protein